MLVLPLGAGVCFKGTSWREECSLGSEHTAELFKLLNSCGENGEPEIFAFIEKGCQDKIQSLIIIQHLLYT